MLRITGKGGKERLVPVLPIVRDAVARYVQLCPYPLEPDEPMFRGAKGGPLSPRLIQLAMERLRETLDLPATATPHALRHSFATHLLVGRRRLAPDPGIARPRIAVDDPGVHRGRPRSAAGRL